VLVDRSSRARLVNWVEIGPLFSMSRRFLDLATPFPESAYMGWGLDHLWASFLRAQGWRAALVDATPVEHTVRPQASRYDPRRAMRSMRRFLRAQGVSAVVPVATPLDAGASRAPRRA
jgi:hypothetical protein